MRLGFFLILCLMLTGCDDSRLRVYYADGLEGCLARQDIKAFNRIASSCETVLAELYGRATSAENYYIFLEDLATSTDYDKLFNNALFQEDMEAYKASDLFTRLMTRSSKTPMGDEMIRRIRPGVKPTEEPLDPFVMKPGNRYALCLKNINEVREVVELIEAMDTGIFLKPHYMADKAATGLEKADYDTHAVRLFIATHIYLQIGMLMPDRE